MKRFLGPLAALLALAFVIALSAYTRDKQPLEADYFKRVSQQGAHNDK